MKRKNQFQATYEYISSGKGFSHIDSNHSHFILVDNGSEGSFGKEIEFRSSLENEIRKGKSEVFYETCRANRIRREKLKSIENNESINDNENDGEILNESEELKTGLIKGIIPMVLIVVQGGPGTLQTVEEAIKQNVPVIVLAVNENVNYNFFCNFYHKL